MWICIARRLLRISNSAADWVALEDSTSGGLAGRISGIEFLNQFEKLLVHAGFDQSEPESAADDALHCGATCQDAEVVAAYGEANLHFGGWLTFKWARVLI